MTRWAKAGITLSIIVVLGLGVWAGWRQFRRPSVPNARAAHQPWPAFQPLEGIEGFARAERPRQFDFPADHGPHPGFQTEWWYYTGNLHTLAGREFGYQLTFFRRALTPGTDREERTSQWAARQIYLAHFALTDVAGGQHHAFERLSRGAAGLAGATSAPYRVWLEDWYVEQVGDDPGIVRLRTSQQGFAVELRLVDRKGPVEHGDRGYSQKGPEPGNASYYYSQTRLETSGTVEIGDVVLAVEGWSWMDHEFSTSALAPGQVGWDWFALQLDDGSDLMAFRIRTSDGAVDAYSSGTVIDARGNARHLGLEDFTVQVEDTWRSPHSAATYPSEWTVRVPDADLLLVIEPVIDDQELNVAYTYWEGAVRIEGERSGGPITGHGYVEMTGYADSMAEQF